MTNTEQSKHSDSPHMVVEERMSPLYKTEYEVTTEGPVSYTVSPILDGFSFYGVKASLGSLPKSLQGRFSSAREALKEVEKVIIAKQTPKKRIEKKVLKNASTDKSDDSQQLLEGAAD